MDARKKFDLAITGDKDNLATRFDLKLTLEPKITDAAGRRQWLKEYAGREVSTVLEGLTRNEVAALGKACLEILSWGLDD